jgi:hypothetical protein
MFGLTGILIYQMYKQYTKLFTQDPFTQDIFTQDIFTQDIFTQETSTQTDIISEQTILQLEKRISELEDEIQILHKKYSCDIRELRESNSELINTFIISNYDLDT